MPGAGPTTAPAGLPGLAGHCGFRPSQQHILGLPSGGPLRQDSCKRCMISDYTCSEPSCTGQSLSHKPVVLCRFGSIVMVVSYVQGFSPDYHTVIRNLFKLSELGFPSYSRVAQGGVPKWPDSNAFRLFYARKKRGNAKVQPSSQHTALGAMYYYCSGHLIRSRHLCPK